MTGDQPAPVADLRPGREVMLAGIEYLVIRRRWDQGNEGLSIDLVRVGGKADPRKPWTPPEDEVEPAPGPRHFPPAPAPAPATGAERFR